MNISIPAAIAREEGWMSKYPPARCRRNLNPGNLEFMQWQRTFGATLEDVPDGEEARFAVFPTAAQGFAALRHLCQLPLYAGKTLEHLIWAWAPPCENNSEEYLKNVCAWTGLTPSTIIDAFLGEPCDDPS